MLEFKPVTYENAHELAPYFSNLTWRITDYTVGTMAMWAEYYNTQFAVHDGFLILKYTEEDGELCFSVPMGTGDLDAALDAVAACAKEMGLPLVFGTVPEEMLPVIIDHFGCTVHVAHTPAWDDYLYDKTDLITLKGRRYNTQRNHINKFIKTYGGYVFEPISEQNLAEVKEFFHNFMTHEDSISEDMTEERVLTMEVLDHYEKLGMTGGIVRVQDKVIALSIGEVVGDTLYVHIEKCRRDYGGGYPVINMEFAKYNDSESLRFINREEDVGLPGLRQAKRQYGPVRMVRKYMVSVPCASL